MSSATPLTPCGSRETILEGRTRTDSCGGTPTRNFSPRFSEMCPAGRPHTEMQPVASKKPGIAPRQRESAEQAGSKSPRSLLPQLDTTDVTRAVSDSRNSPDRCAMEYCGVGPIAAVSADGLASKDGHP
eukprot:1380690-Amphidinium_carterae.1